MTLTKHRDGTVSLRMSEADAEVIRQGLSSAWHRSIGKGAKQSQEEHRFGVLADELLDLLYPRH